MKQYTYTLYDFHGLSHITLTIVVDEVKTYTRLKDCRIHQADSDWDCQDHTEIIWRVVNLELFDGEEHDESSDVVEAFYKVLDFDTRDHIECFLWKQINKEKQNV